MPLPAGAVAFATAKHVALHLATTENLYTLSSASLAYILTRLAYHHMIPDWIKHDVAMKHMIMSKNNKSLIVQENNNNDKNELTNLSSIIEKLQGLAMNASHNMTTNQIQSVPYSNAAFLLYIQLVVQINTIHKKRVGPTALNTPSFRSSLLSNTTTTAKNEITFNTQDQADTTTTTTILPEESSSMIWQSEMKQAAEGIKNSFTKETTNSNHTFEHEATGSDHPYTILQLLDFAILAYENDINKLQEQLNERHPDKKFVIVQHHMMDNTSTTNNTNCRRPGYVGHYIAICDQTQTMVIGIKGTSTLEDLLMDCCGRAVTYIRQLDVIDPYEETRIEVCAKQPHHIIFHNNNNNNTSNKRSNNNNSPIRSSVNSNIIRSGNKQEEVKNDDGRISSSSEGEEFGFEIISGHERIWIEQDTTLSSTPAVGNNDNNDDNNIIKIHDDADDNDYWMKKLNNSNYNNKDMNQEYYYNNDQQESNCIRCHEGILIATKRLANKVQKNVEYYVIEKNYQLLICGHSLGAGAASLLGIVLRERLPSLVSYNNNTTTTTTPSPFSSTSTSTDNKESINTSIQQQQQKERIRVYAFAPPPVVDYDTSISSSSYITSFVNDCDIIPRSSLANLLVFMDILNNTIYNKMIYNNIIPNTVSGTISFIQKLSKGSNDNEFLLSYNEIQLAILNAMNKLELRHRDHLFIPGKVILMMSDNDNNDNDNTNDNDINVNSHTSNNPQSLPSFNDDQNKEMDGVTNEVSSSNKKPEQNQNEEQQPMSSNTTGEITTVDNNINKNNNNMKWIVTDCSESVVRFFELHSFQFMTDHLTSSYENSLQSIINIQSSTSS